MFRRDFLVSGVVVMLALCFPAQGMSADKCEIMLHNTALFVVGNGFDGNSGMNDELPVTKQSDGTFAFHGTLQMTNEPKDTLVGTCKDRHIKFSRTRPGVFVQKYDGWLFEKSYKKGHGLQEMAGTITSGGVTKWGWYGWIDLTQPK